MMISSLIKRILGKDAQEILSPREGRLFIRISREKLRESVKRLAELEGFSHLSTITGVDTGSEIELIYHLSHRDALVSLRVFVSKEAAAVPTIVDLIPGASLYEREVHDLFGVRFDGNTDLSPLLLPDDWPEDIHPLRQEWSLERINERMREK
ncbi:MAG: NADH-quinone oxidoreductase subunit C [Aigarchaeota archaeon]|nr:NADH-quinone oxidoreductase subunit C [Aigarchaeota archaeon]MDH5686792.1 NADH-quinone oxidoreductase subunit C [Candidatus Bathyarchaeota archaeon]